MLVSLKALRLLSIAHSPPRLSSDVSSAGGGGLNDKMGEKDTERESKDKEKNGERKGSKEAGLCICL